MPKKVGIYSEVERRAGAELVRQIVRVIRSWRLYEGDHPTLEALFEQLRGRWQEATRGGAITIRLTETEVRLENEVLLSVTRGRNDVVPTVLYECGIIGLVLKPHIEKEEATRFVRVLAREPGPAIDYATLIWEAELDHVELLFESEGPEENAAVDAPAFAARLEALPSPRDPSTEPDYEEERGEVERMARASMPSLDPDLFETTRHERLRILALLQNDHYGETIRHLGRMLHDMARRPVPVTEEETLCQAIVTVGTTMCASGDLEGAIEMLERADEMAKDKGPRPRRVIVLTREIFSEEGNLLTMLRALDTRDQVDARFLSRFLSKLQQTTANVVCAWMLETSHPGEAARAVEAYGDAAVAYLVPLFQKESGLEERDRIAEALLEIQTPEALCALAGDFAALPEQVRLTLLRKLERSQDGSLREVLVQALDDDSERVRRNARRAMRRADEELVAGILPPLLEEDAWAYRTPSECTKFFEMLARIGGAKVAGTLAAECEKGGLRLRLRGLTPMQERCARALRRMRSREAKEIVERLKTTGPKQVREILDDPLADLET